MNNPPADVSFFYDFIPSSHPALVLYDTDYGSNPCAGTVELLYALHDDALSGVSRVNNLALAAVNSRVAVTSASFEEKDIACLGLLHTVNR